MPTSAFASVLPALALKTDYLSSDTPLAHFRQGAADQLASNERGLNREVGQIAAGGNYLEAARAAMAGGNLKTGMDIQNWDQDRKTKAIDFLLKGSETADTPEKWTSWVNMVGRTFGPEMTRGYESFANKPSAVTALQRVQMEASRATADAHRAQAEASRAQVPYHQAHAESMRAATELATRKAQSNREMMEYYGFIAPAPPTAPPAATTPPIAPAVRPLGVSGMPPTAAPSVNPRPAPIIPPVPPVVPVPAPRAAAPPVAPLAAPSAAASTAPSAPRTLRGIANTMPAPVHDQVRALFAEGKTEDAMRVIREFAEGPFKDHHQKVQAAEGMRKEFMTLPVVKDYVKASTAAERLKSLVLNSDEFGSGSGDIASVITFMKTLEPESAVLPGEAATARQAPGFTDRFLNSFNAFTTGKFLTKDTRNDYLKIIDLEIANRLKPALQEAKRYRTIAKQSGIRPSQVVDPAFGGGLPQVFDEEDYEALASGEFIDPKGARRRKP